MAESKEFGHRADVKTGIRIEIQGAVQGVGFRPFVYRLASELRLDGWVVNGSRGVEIEVEGPSDRIATFRQRLENEVPPRALILEICQDTFEPLGSSGFRILESNRAGAKTAVMLPEVATCPECLAELRSPEDRRFGYPFTNCTNCGPRFTIIEDLPYDRPNTTMRLFRMCPQCQAEYDDPENRRYHAQPNACPNCGPQLEILDRSGATKARELESLDLAVEALNSGKILALKGLGGFHLMVDARSEAAVARLRHRKMRYEKPLALMVRDVSQATEICVSTEAEIEFLSSPEAPIVLLRRRPDAQIADAVAPDNPRLGLMLPYSPLHHLLLHRIDYPVVATSGNLSDEPICIDNREAVERLSGIADLFLVHDRPITRHCDDSVVHCVEERPQPIRRARGLAPMPVMLESSGPEIVAVGGHLKNVVALCKANKVFLSQHIGDMETVEAREAFEAVLRDFLRMYDAQPVAVAHDLHPDYPTSLWAQDHFASLVDESVASQARLIGVQHHHAHLASCLVDNQDSDSCLGVIWDGTGYGSDGTIWGGEFLQGNATGFLRRARLRPFSLPGGDAAVRRPSRSALAVLWEIWGAEGLDRLDTVPQRFLAENEVELIGQMLDQKINCPTTTSAGRLFDAVAALLDLRQQVAFEGQAAMMLEFIADESERVSYPFDLSEDSPDGVLEVDWEPTIRRVLEDIESGVSSDLVAARFHNMLVDAIEAVATTIGDPKVALSGGCFQNRLLAERTARRLRSRGFDVLTHHQVPCNDGGISLGQIAVAAARLQPANL
jgi:hydrogenase maturation protein HypF